MHVVVLGSGIIGTASAWYLSQAGHQVTVLDRQLAPALETSFANGCQISVSYSEPWANPSAPLKLLNWLGREDAPLLFRPRLDWQQWLWGLAFLRECLPGRLAPNIRAMVNLSQYSRDLLRLVRQQQNIDYDQVSKGILNFYCNQAEFEASQQSARLMREFGVERNIVSTQELINIEPALTPYKSHIVGGDYTADDESGDIFKFTSTLAQLSADRGVNFKFGHTITQLIHQGGRVAAVEVINPQGCFEQIRGDVFVVALASHSAALVKPLGIPCLVYPTKGYSATYEIIEPHNCPIVSLTDSEHKIVFSRIGNRIRVAGTAELNGYSRDLNAVRCEALTTRTRELFPTALDFENVKYWSGLRPSTPSNVPLIGRTHYKNLYLNTGHGTLGWTMGCGSGKVIADLISGQRPEIDFPFL